MEELQQAWQSEQAGCAYKDQVVTATHSSRRACHDCAHRRTGYGTERIEGRASSILNASVHGLRLLECGRDMGGFLAPRKRAPPSGLMV